jgi:3-deoxy-D-manno-octulosonate 8-phosphate phosphatase (KDO 8-P phosphatase)
MNGQSSLTPHPQPFSPEGRGAESLAQRAAAVRLLVLDVDGVLTDGRITYTAEGVELKSFHVRDGSGLVFWRRLGGKTAIISGRTSKAVDIRAAEIGITLVIQGSSDKRADFDRVLEATGLGADEACAIGDDLPDLLMLRASGLAAAVADGCPEVRAAAHYVTRTPGGRGAVREVVELLLRAQGRWCELTGN